MTAGTVLLVGPSVRHAAAWAAIVSGIAAVVWTVLGEAERAAERALNRRLARLRSRREGRHGLVPGRWRWAVEPAPAEPVPGPETATSGPEEGEHGLAFNGPMGVWECVCGEWGEREWAEGHADVTGAGMVA